MSFLRPDNAICVLLDDNTATTLPPVGDVVTAGNLGAGAVCLVDVGLRRLDLAAFTGLANGDKFMVVQGKGTGNPLVKSPVITVGNYTTSIQRHLPALQQVTVIGFNGTTGTMPNANDTSYYIKIRKNDNDAGNRSQPMSLFGQYLTGGAATVTEVAFGLAVNLQKNMEEEAPGTNGYLSVEVLSDGTTAALPVADVTSGSTTVVSTAHGLVAGDFVSFAAGVTYQVASVLDANTYILSTPYVGATATGIASNSVTAITVTGIRLTGIMADFDVNSFRDYYANRFTATFNDTDTLVTSVQGARSGAGVWQKVALDEYMSYGQEGQNGMIGVPPTLRDQEVKIPGVGGETALTSRYSTLNIRWTEVMQNLTARDGAQGNVMVYVNLDDSAPLGILDTTGSTGETLVEALGLTATDFDMIP